MKIIPLSEGVFTIDKTKIFVPFDPATDDLQQRPTGSLLVEVLPFVVVTEKDVLLLDTGLGFSRNGDMQLITNLKANGIDPGSITKVLLTHLHKDHAGGVSRRDRFGHYQLTFPAANYYVQQQEYRFATDTGFPSFMPEEISVLENNPGVVFLDGNGVIDDYIYYEVTGAHSPFHQVFWIKENNETVFFGGDEAPQLQQMKSKFVAKYDADGKKAMQLRQVWWQQGNDQRWRFLFYHDVNTPVFQGGTTGAV